MSGKQYIHERIEVEIKRTISAGRVTQDEGVLGVSEVDGRPNGAGSNRHIALKVCEGVGIGKVDVL